MNPTDYKPEEVIKELQVFGRQSLASDIRKACTSAADHMQAMLEKIAELERLQERQVDERGGDELPVAVIYNSKDDYDVDWRNDEEKLPHGTKLYATPPDTAARIAELEAEIAEMQAGFKQGWRICDDVAAALGDELNRDEGSAYSVRHILAELTALRARIKEAEEQEPALPCWKPIGYARKQDLAEYRPIIAMYANKMEAENGHEPMALYSEDQILTRPTPAQSTVPKSKEPIKCVYCGIELRGPHVCTTAKVGIGLALDNLTRDAVEQGLYEDVLSREDALAALEHTMTGDEGRGEARKIVEAYIKGNSK